MDKTSLKKLRNTFTALITPFKENGDLWEEKIRAFMRFQIENGVGVVPMGTTGESATMSHAEHQQIVQWCVEEAEQSQEKPFVLAGTGSNSTKEAVELCQAAEQMEVDGLLLITPYYNKPTQRGLIAHYSKIAESVDLPIVVYNCPSRTGGNILPETVATLAAKYDNIAAYKAADGDINQITQVINQTPEDFIVMSGDDGLTFEVMKAGGLGVISVASNIIPKRMVEFTKLMNAGDFETAAKENETLMSLFTNIFVETNPAPIKYCAAKMGIIPHSTVRLPLVSIEEKSQELLDKTLIDLSLI